MTTEEHQKLSEETHQLCLSIKAALKGDDMGSTGLVETVKNLTKRVEINNAKLDVHIEQYKAKENKRSGIWVTLVALWSAFLFFVGKFFHW